MKSLFPSVIICGIFAAAIVLTGRATHDRREWNRLAGRAEALAAMTGVSVEGALGALGPGGSKNLRAVPFKADHGILGAWSADGSSRAILFRGSGLWGPMTGIVLVAPEPALDATSPWTIRGLKILENCETPSLGGKIASPEFLAVFEKLPLGPGGKLHLDAVTGATRTCDRLKKIVELAISGGANE